MSTRSDDSRTAGAGPPVWCALAATGVVLSLHVQPGARRSGIVGTHGACLKVAVRAPAVDGRANDALLDLLADALALSRHALRIRSGANARDKRVLIETEAPGPLIDALRALSGGAGR